MSNSRQRVDRTKPNQASAPERPEPSANGNLKPGEFLDTNTGEILPKSSLAPQSPTDPAAPFWSGLDKAESGLRLIGTVTARSRTFLERGTEKIEKITYRVVNDGPDIMLDDLAPPGYLTIGTLIDVPIFVRPWARKNGTPAFSVSVARPRNDMGEVF